VCYIPTNLNFADIMTKELVPKMHKEGVDLIVNTKDVYRMFQNCHRSKGDVR
jgi:hypothetical protein